MSGELRLLEAGSGDLPARRPRRSASTRRDLVFVDNREANVRGAESIGVTGHVYTDPASLRAFLESLA